MGGPVLFCSTAALARYGAGMRAAGEFEVLELVPGQAVEASDIERIDIAFFSSDVFPESAPNFMRVCLDAANLRWLHVFNAGVDHPVFGMFLDRGVRLSTSSGASGISIAQHVAMCLLALARDLPQFLRNQAAHDWQQRHVGDLEGRTVGVVGMGPIGVESARLATELGMSAIGMRRKVRGDEPCETWTFDRLHELLARIDDLVLALPLTDDTRGLIGADQIALMRPGSRIVNVGRGELIDEPAMIEALRSGQLSGAALDVFATEPLPAESPLWDMPNVIVTPHSSGSTTMTERRSGEMFVENLARYLRDEPLRNEVRR